MRNHNTDFSPPFIPSLLRYGKVGNGHCIRVSVAIAQPTLLKDFHKSNMISISNQVDNQIHFHRLPS